MEGSPIFLVPATRDEAAASDKHSVEMGDCNRPLKRNKAGSEPTEVKIETDTCEVPEMQPNDEEENVDVEGDNESVPVAITDLGATPAGASFFPTAPCFACAEAPSLVTPQPHGAITHLPSPPQLTVASSVSSFEGQVPANLPRLPSPAFKSPPALPASQFSGSSEYPSDAGSQGEESSSEGTDSRNPLPSGNLELLYQGHMAVVLRDPARHCVEKIVTKRDMHGQPVPHYHDKATLLEEEWSVYQSIGEHPNIVRTINFINGGDFAVLVMEDLVEQRYTPLIRNIESGPPYLADLYVTVCLDILKIVRGLCEALVCVHAADILHGDLSVNNIMIQRRIDGDVSAVKLLDFNCYIDLQNGCSASPFGWVGAESISPPEVDAPDMLGRQTLEGYPSDYVRPRNITTAADMWGVGRLVFMMVMRALDITNDLAVRELSLDTLPSHAGPLFAYTDSDGRKPGPMLKLQNALVAMDPAQRPSARDALLELDNMRLW